MNEFGGRGGVLARCDARFRLSAGVAVGSGEGEEAAGEEELESGENAGMKETYSGISTVTSQFPVDKLVPMWDVLSCGDCSLNVL